MYRGKNGNTWYYGALLRVKGETQEKDRFFISDTNNVIANEFYPYCGFANIPVYAKSVGESTGLTDKNGRIIYENDLIRIDENNEPPVFGSVVWNHLVGSWWFETINTNGKTDSIPLAKILFTGTIVGNTIDNPGFLPVLFAPLSPMEKEPQQPQQPTANKTETKLQDKHPK